MHANVSPGPVARITGLITTEAGDELLIYDQESHHLHHLNAVATQVWRLCDGTRSVANIARNASLSDETVRLALDRLAKANLLAEPQDPAVGAPARSRRSLLRKAAIAGAVPVIVSVTAPMAASATSDPRCDVYYGPDIICAQTGLFVTCGCYCPGGGIPDKAYCRNPGIGEASCSV